MTSRPSIHPAIDLYVENRIAREDATRQRTTASEILKRFETQAGVILADEVGMGKTFVALAVTATAALEDPEGRPVVVMVPSSVKEKWPRDFEIFREYCLPNAPAERQRLNCASATSPVEFLKLLDDPPERRKAVIFLTHGAMSRRLKDPFVKLALIQQALKHRRDVDPIRQALCRYAGDLLQAGWLHKRDPELWGELLRRRPERWLQVLRRREMDRGNDTQRITEDNPVPAHLVEVLSQLDTEPLFAALQQLPLRKSSNYPQRLKIARQAINQALNVTWKAAVKALQIRLPLLILDEAHHMKNAGTQLASLFEGPEAEADADVVAGGELAGAFERMLFLTATPFQLGHHELCNILERFRGIAWDGLRPPRGGLVGLDHQIETLRTSLDAAQEAAVRLEQNWSRLTREDLQVNGTAYDSPDAWWSALRDSNELTAAALQARARIDYAAQRLQETEAVLKPWIIRHTRSQYLPNPFKEIRRRRRIVGRGILDESAPSECHHEPGLPVQGEAMLPFLLAARLVACTPESRPVFAEGLASSYEAFLDTRRVSEDRFPALDNEDEVTTLPRIDDAGAWYLDQIGKAVEQPHDAGRIEHPKLSATVNRAMALWRQGEKVLIFCHYVATGRGLREALSAAIDRTVKAQAAEQLGILADEVPAEMQRLASRLDKGEVAARACAHQVDLILRQYPNLAAYVERLHDIVLRFLRRPSFMIRYFELSQGVITAQAVTDAFKSQDDSGLRIYDLVDRFMHFLEKRCGEADREAYIRAVETIQTGTHYGGEAVDVEEEEERRHAFVSNVRLVNGATKHETRQRLMLAFNTPFYPEILVTSSVMSEGVDLHLNCRHVIHHDLAWNPSNLEQRTGRVDRIGAKAEHAGKPIHVYLPYVAETQDEKMYRVVMDRENWFNVVMGGTIATDAQTTEKLAERIPLPQAVRDALIIDLSLDNKVPGNDK